MRCIFCMEEKKEIELTEEHVFPDSIGGLLKINVVCKSCNDYLGNVDVLLTDHWLIKCRRNFYGITGKKRKLPNPFEYGFYNGSLVQNRINTDNQRSIYLVNQGATINEDESGIDIKLTLDKSDEHKALSMINKILSRRNLQQLTPDEYSQKFYSEEHYEKNPSILFKPKVDIFSYKKAILKICYELGFHWLGEKYLDDEIAANLRQIILNPSDDFDLDGIEERIDLYDSTNSLWMYWEDNPNSHYAFLQAFNNKLVICIRIFNVFTGYLTISDQAKDYSDIQASFIEINPITKEIRELPFHQECLNIAKRMYKGDT